ncbi:uncharacterized protein F4822DRAFT_108749 [Hypoxylon trugodes]|uniref:uncharacterized protein n=1 Tax=Hypoxylon trugodes TaxID=326681 RepID=UPI0021981F0C|nr:uncharacterized protein F4822DRAFT_108749 [Hypoxylon trugodes]KAI1391890.1 hypothetical protein F4822DRAFT_108749 [Hypoxylon trugodes]
MAAYDTWTSTLYPSEKFVEACGAVVFDTSERPKRILLLYHAADDEWLLPKGRRNCNESRKEAAIREIREESGYDIKICPMTMATRAPAEVELAGVKDVPRIYDSLTEPFILDVRDLSKGNEVKLVWWFIAELDGYAGEGEVQFKPQFFPCDKAVERLTFQKDREVLLKALELIAHATEKRIRPAESGVELAHGGKDELLVSPSDTTLEPTV